MTIPVRLLGGALLLAATASAGLGAGAFGAGGVPAAVLDPPESPAEGGSRPARGAGPAPGNVGAGAPVRTPSARPNAAPQDAGYQVPYNGAFTFTRIRYGPGGGLGGVGRRGWRRGSSWSHDYPDGDRNLQTILDEFTAMHPNTRGSNVLELEDPEIFKHPILYISEPGFWTVSDGGARNLREFLLKGGFLIFDDFEHVQWNNMAAQMARVLPRGEWVEVDGSHPLFQSFFPVEDIYVPHPLVDVTPRYMVIFEDNDPRKRVMVLANHNADLAEYWEWSPRGYFPVDPTNDAYRLGINFIIYGLTH